MTVNAYFNNYNNDIEKATRKQTQPHRTGGGGSQRYERKPLGLVRVSSRAVSEADQLVSVSSSSGGGLIAS